MPTNVSDEIDELSGESGPWMGTWGKTCTGTVFTAGSGKAVVNGPVVVEEYDELGQARRADTITFEASAAALAEPVIDKTIVYGGATYVVRGVERADSGMKTLRASRRRTTETGRRAKE